MKKGLSILISLIILIIFNSCFGKEISIKSIKQNQRIYDQNYELYWTDIKNIEEYLIEVSTDEKFSEITASESVNRSYANFGLDIKLADGDYYIRIKKMIKGIELGAWSEPVFFHYHPVEIEITEPLSGIPLEQNVSFTISYTSETTGPGTSRIQIAKESSFETMVFNETVDNGRDLRVKAPELPAGYYYIRLMFSSEDGSNILYSDAKEIRLERPVLWIHPDSVRLEEVSVERVLSNGSTFPAGKVDYMEDSNQIVINGNRVLFGKKNEEENLYFLTSSGSLRQVNVDQMANGNWTDIDKGSNKIYLLGSRDTENGTQAYALQLNQTGNILREIKLDTMVEWENEADVSESIKDILIHNDSLFIAGDSQSKDGENAIWIAKADKNGNVLKKNQFIGNQNIKLLDYITTLENIIIYLGEVQEENGYEKKPVLFYYYMNEGTIQKIELLAPKSYTSGVALSTKGAPGFLLGWGPYLYYYGLMDNDTDVLEPWKSLEIKSESNLLNSIDITYLEESDYGTLVFGEYVEEPIIRTFAFEYFITEERIEWQLMAPDEVLLKVIEHNLNQLESEEDWAP